MVALLEMNEQGGDLALQDGQKKRLRDMLQAQDRLRALGQVVARMEALLTPGQREFLDKNRDSLGSVEPGGRPPAEAARALLEQKAGRAEPATAPPGVQEGGPRFDPMTLSRGLLRLEQEGGPLAFSPAQAAGLVQLLEEILETEEEAAGGDSGALLTEAQERWIEARRDRFDPQAFLSGSPGGSPSPGLPAPEVESAVRRRLEEVLAR